MTAPDSVVDLVPIDDLDRAIVGLTTRINAATYELLVLVRQFDERVGWLRWGLQNCAEWLHWRCDLSMNAAREKVRVAHALKTLPVMSTAFAAGELSYSKCRALTRVANGANEQELVDHALKTTTRCVEERCREMRCGTRLSSADAERAFARRSLFVRRDEARGTTTITIELTSEHAVHVDQSALAGGEGRAGLPVETVRRLCCDGSTIALVEDNNGEPLNVGRKTRVVPKAIMRALRARDKDYQDRWTFYRPDGIAVPHCGYHVVDQHDDAVKSITDPVNNPPRGGLMNAADCSSASGRFDPAPP